MINTPWIDPRSIDWTDPNNPLRWRAWNQQNNRYMYDTLNDPVWQALRNAKNLEPRIIVTPVPINQQIAPLSTFDQSVSIEPVTWLYALNATGTAMEGFYCQITDALTGATVFSQLIHNIDLTAAYPATLATTFPGRLRSNPGLKDVSPTLGALIYLSAPRLFAAPSYPVVRIVNLADVTQTCTLNMFCVVEIDESKPGSTAAMQNQAQHV